MIKSVTILLLLFFAMTKPTIGQISSAVPTMVIKKTNDFELTGDGSSEAWNQTEWIELTQRLNLKNTSGYTTRLKVLYSEKGFYALFESQDSLITTPFESDFEELWLGDVVEVFLWTDTSKPSYFEYELTPLDYELTLIVSNIDGELSSWIPFDNTYQGDQKVRHKTAVGNGEKKNGATIDLWTAEMFIPFKLLHPLEDIYPESGTTWRGNFYRIDYDVGETHWSWSPYDGNFHDYENFGVLRFE